VVVTGPYSSCSGFAWSSGSSSRPPSRRRSSRLPSSRRRCHFEGDERGVPSETVSWWANQSLAIAGQQGTPQPLRYRHVVGFKRADKCAASRHDDPLANPGRLHESRPFALIKNGELVAATGQTAIDDRSPIARRGGRSGSREIPPACVTKTPNQVTVARP
jgi:hypothetical protein